MLLVAVIDSYAMQIIEVVKCRSRRVTFDAMAATQAPATTDRRDAADEAWDLMSRILFAQRGRMLAIAGELDLHPQQLFALKHLEEPTPMGALADRLHCDSSNVTGIVDRLEKRGLVERRSDGRDRRVKLLVLTEEGERVRSQVLARMSQPAPEIAALSAADQRALRDILRRAFDAAA
jgi:DNA-binding MarR family transcriptional regulator